MTKNRILGVVWFVLIAFTAWYVYKNLRPGILR